MLTAMDLTPGHYIIQIDSSIVVKVRILGMQEWLKNMGFSIIFILRDHGDRHTLSRCQCNVIEEPLSELWISFRLLSYCLW